ncbi:unnamed protein product [Zymoseptoria tritici ST99CH_3D1]|uniref:DUF7918 domain-containing protein n=3 Tax=Zymoseptoria tritici TaxID=1047171 RepID=F9X661_ZYMTI|nr:uncharacterized protein MYCGRDRAFT_91546 [Zymoseptoria tritici IPO323]EGP88721.1 hypothetical protein MYCGRDRAFT_91546 [Zymoseptoria tritici IPO323]SMQ48630.1 unnamed protein product [Zymoseptoria tritici ST99CH_3D7]SMR48415.1 unnamed protein product [Zymoseptoria tritici ST99CH_1E4]SMR49628.1 unnamed protein product [Zymoseptoria tritici ST99CH_3D1]
MKANFLKGVSVKLLVDGIQLEEYNDEDSIDGEEDTCTRYVQVVPNSTFKIAVQIESNFRYRLDDLVVEVSLDGERVDDLVISSDPNRNTQYKELLGPKAFTKGKWQRQPYTFGSLDTTDESLKPDRAAKLKDLLSRLGEVSVKLLRVKARPGTLSNADEKKARGLRTSEIGNAVPEKALKGRSISNKATLGMPEPTTVQTYITVDYPYGHKPVAIFTFKYRSRKDLQIENVIPRSPSPQPLEERDRATLSAEELRELLRRVEERAADETRVKKELKRERSTTITLEDEDDDEDDEGVEIIAEAPARKRTRTSGDSGVVVLDLTEED